MKYIIISRHHSLSPKERPDLYMTTLGNWSPDKDNAVFYSDQEAQRAYDWIMKTGTYNKILIQNANRHFFVGVKG